MKVLQKPQEKQYPYLAIMNFGDPIKTTATYDVDDIMVVSMVQENSDEDKKLLKEFGLFGPPAIMFFKDGKELKNKRLIGTGCCYSGNMPNIRMFT